MPGQVRESRTATVREELAQRIDNGTWRPTERLPAEPELAASLGVSRATLREALRSLQEDGFVTRIRGAGTFVTFRPRLKNNLDVNFGVTDLIRSMGMRPGARGLRTSRRRVTPDEAAGLRVAPDMEVVCLERVRTADDRPVVFSIDVIPASLLEDHSRALDRLGQGSIYGFLEEVLGLAVRQGVASIRPQNADRFLAERLGVPEGTLMLYLLQVDYDGQGRAILLSHEHHLADAFEITVVRRGPGPRTKEPS
jgi:GntR family transcriptional regulator